MEALLVQAHLGANALTERVIAAILRMPCCEGVVREWALRDRLAAVKLNVKLMGLLADRRGDLPDEWPEGTVAQDVFDHLGIGQSDVQAVSVNGQLVRDLQHALRDGDELVLIPPVGGG